MNKTLSSFLGWNQSKPEAAVVVVAGGNPAPASDAPEKKETPENPTPEAQTPAAPTAPTAPKEEANMVSISKDRFAALEKAEKELTDLKPQYEILNTWYNNVKGEGTGAPTQDANAGGGEKKSWQKAPWNQ